MNRRNLITLAAIAAMLAGCASSSHVLVGTARPPISPDQVKIYTHAPEKYEEIAVIDASSKGSFSPGDQRKIDKVMARLKAQAASLGANGVLLQETGEKYAGSAGSGFGTANYSGHSAFGTGFGVSAGIFDKTGKGIAIYVP